MNLAHFSQFYGKSVNVGRQPVARVTCVVIILFVIFLCLPSKSKNESNIYELLHTICIYMILNDSRIEFGIFFTIHLQVCHSGSCNGSICALVGLKDCFLTEGKPSQLCHLACEKNGSPLILFFLDQFNVTITLACYSSFDLPEFAAGKFHQTNRQNLSGLLLHPGSPCNNYKGRLPGKHNLLFSLSHILGYCDILRKCRSVDSNGPLARLKNLFFNKHTYKSVSQWVQV